MDIGQQALRLHRQLKGKISVVPKIKIKNRRQLSLIYTPGVAAVSQYLAKNKSNLSKYTIKNNSVAVISDGSAVLGLGNIGPEGALPVMEGKCLIFKSFANIDAFPIVLSTQDPDEIIKHSESVKFFDSLGRHTGMSQQEINQDLKEKIKILDFMVKHSIRKIDAVGKVMREFYLNKDNLIKLMNKGNVKEILR